MSAHDDGGPAFPTDGFQISAEGISQRQGMSLRDWFAGQALVMLGSYFPLEMVRAESEFSGHATQHTLAFNAFKLADAMLAERSRL